MKKSLLPKAKKLRERAYEMKLKGEHFLRDADRLIQQAEAIEKAEGGRAGHEDVNQAAARILREVTKG